MRRQYMVFDVLTLAIKTVVNHITICCKQDLVNDELLTCTCTPIRLPQMSLDSII